MIRRAVVANLALSAGVTLTFLGLAEAWARYTERPAAVRPLADTRGIDWQAEWDGDFYVMKSTSAGWPPWQEINSDGLRDRRRPRAKPARTHRVACLGDSVTFGYGGARADAWPQQLEQKLAALGPGVEVLNVALGGWSTRQQRYAYERIARGYQPDTVLLGICLNDIEDLQNNLSRPPRLLSLLFVKSALVRRLVDSEARQIASIEELWSLPEPPKVSRGYDRLFAEIRRLQAEVRKDGARLVVMLFPDARQVDADRPPALPQERVRAFAAAHGLAFIDPLPALRRVGPAAFRDRLHLTAVGSATVAEAVMAADAIPASAWATDALRRASEEQRDAPPTPLERLTILLRHADPEVRRQAAWAIGRRDATAAAEHLARALADGDASVRTEAARALGAADSVPASVRATLFGALSDEAVAVRWAAADALEKLEEGGPDEVARLVAALESPDSYVRGFAAWSLGRLRAGAEAARALQAHTQDPEPGVRILAVRALGNVGATSPEVIAALAQAVSTGTNEERWRAARALAKHGADAAPAVPALVAALGAEDEKVRREAALALARMGPAAEPALPALVAARRDPAPGVRDAAERAIRRLTQVSR